MALKRTRKPFYGKADQRMEAHARDQLRAGNTEAFDHIMGMVRARERVKIVAHYTRMASRAGAFFERAPAALRGVARQYMRGI